MKKNLPALILIGIALCFLAFCVGFLLGQSQQPQGLQISLSRQEAATAPPQSSAAPAASSSARPTASGAQPEPTETAEPPEPSASLPVATVTTEPSFPLDLNSATVEELTCLPGIGPVLAQRIVDWRQTYGLFPSVEALSAVEGIGEKRIEAIYDYVTVEVSNEDSGS